MENENFTGMEMNEGTNEGSKAMAVTALVFGILSMVCCCVGFPFAIPGLIISIIVLVKHKNGKGLAIGGLITSAITLLISILILISMLPSLPYISGYFDFGMNAAEYIEEYEEDGSLPPVFEQMIDDGLIDEDAAEQTMDQIINQYGDQFKNAGK